MARVSPGAPQITPAALAAELGMPVGTEQEDLERELLRRTADVLGLDPDTATKAAVLKHKNLAV